ncbi:MAG TPA: hypothetical protein VM012_02320 [Flavitalea sp.]|nr:hypothetical protein [Flavitalea sp.]
MRIAFCYVLVLLIAGCGGDTTSRKEGEVGINDFLQFFPEADLPYELSDNRLQRKENDSAAIAYSLLTQFIPDTVFSADFGKTSTPLIYPLARAVEKNHETYLFIKAVQGAKKVGYVLCLDKKLNFQNSLVLVRIGPEKYGRAYGSVDRKFQITTYRDRKLPNGETSFKRNVYVYNSGGNVFNLILTEPNEEMIEKVFNPIDTFPRKNKFTGDYIRNSENIVSFRDAKKAGELLFFIHFEKDKGSCIGELRGTARITAANRAEYHANGNPCTLEFSFASTSVTLKETAGCGSYRDIKCFFEGTFPRKKVVKPKALKPNNTQ